MKKITFIVLFFAAAITGRAQTVSTSDFQAIKGNWKGQLTYLDYTTGKPETINAAVQAWIPASDRIMMHFDYPNEPGYASNDTFLISSNGTTVNGMKLIENKTTAAGRRIVVEEKATDGNDNKPATIRYVLELGAGTFSLSKLVKFEGATEFFERNKYAMVKN